MEAHDFKLNKVPLFSRKSVNISVSRFAAPKLALVPLFARKPVNFNVSRYAAPKLARVPARRYNCDIKESNLNVSVKFH